MFAFLPLIVFGALGQMVHGWSMDASCAPIGVPLAAAMTLAFQRARDARDEIRKVPRDVHVNALVTSLFGRDSAKASDVEDRLARIQRLSTFRTTKTGPYDVHVYCSTARITDWIDKKKKVGYKDPHRNSRVKGGAQMDSCRGISQGDTMTRALMINLGKAKNDKGEDNVEIMADTLQLCEGYLAQLGLSGFAMTDDLIKRAADVKAKGLVGKFIAKLTGGETAAPIDSTFDFASVLLHEMTHSATSGYSDDTPAGKCYGWKNSAKCQLSKNADSLAYFALGVDLVLHNHGDKKYTINKDGTLQELV